MTVEERLDRIEHISAGLAEERRKDREEYKMLWRDTNDAIKRLADETRVGVDKFRKETLAADRMLGQRIDQLGGRLDQMGQQLEGVGARIDGLVSAIGTLLRDQNKRQE
jgi:hypothetical protein